MQDNDNTLYSLSRRKMLAGIGAVGLASAGAGLGTSALFSDTEAFAGNSITAGTLDMTVTATIMATSPYFSDAVGLTADADDTSAVAGLVVDDVKPGDWAIVCFDVEVGDNPGYLMVTTENAVDQDNGHTEPESSVDPDAAPDDPGQGELDDAILASLWYSYDDTNGDKNGLMGLDGTSNEASGDLPGQGYEMPSPLAYNDANYGATGDADVQYTTMRELYDFYSAGYVVKNPDSSPLVIDSDDPDTDAGHLESFRICLLLELPDFIGNVVQSDSFAFDIRFDTEQIRNNPTPFAPEQTPTPTTTPTTTPTI